MRFGDARPLCTGSAPPRAGCDLVGPDSSSTPSADLPSTHTTGAYPSPHTPIAWPRRPAPTSAPPSRLYPRLLSSTLWSRENRASG